MVFEPNEFTPNDPLLEKAWHLQTLKMPVAWDITRGEGVLIAVLDSGINPAHEDLAGQVLPGWNAASGGADTSDINGMAPGWPELSARSPIMALVSPRLPRLP